MQLTIDSAEPLDTVLQVLSALYGVPVARCADELPAGLPAAAGSEPADSAPAPAPGPGKPAGRRTGTRPRRPGSDVDEQAVRAWARENGHPVSSRGRLSRTLIAAYQQANSQ